MTDKEILKKAIDKARTGNLDFNIHEYFTFIEFPEVLIFDHDFAKAFWGDEQSEYKVFDDSELPEGCFKVGSNLPEFQGTIELPLWKFHLSQMVLEEEPLKYLEKFLND